MRERLKIGYGAAAIALLLAIVLVAGCTTSAPSAAPATPKSVAFANPDLLVTAEWLSQHLNDANVRVVDVRKPSDYKSGHIKNSLNIDTTDLKGPMYDQSNPVKWTVLSKEQLERLLSDAGVSKDTIVVALDDARGLWAARFFWTLEYYGHGNGKARVLDGGLKKWQAEKRELTTEVQTIKKTTYVAKVDPSPFASKQQVLDAIGKKDSVILATIPEAEFKGGNAKDHLKGGHIPGAVRLDWVENLTSGDVPVMKSAAELAAQYEAVGVVKDKNTILY